LLRLVSRPERNPGPISRSAWRTGRDLVPTEEKYGGYGDLEIALGSSCNLEIALSEGSVLYSVEMGYGDLEIARGSSCNLEIALSGGWRWGWPVCYSSSS